MEPLLAWSFADGARACAQLCRAVPPDLGREVFAFWFGPAAGQDPHPSFVCLSPSVVVGPGARVRLREPLELRELPAYCVQHTHANRPGKAQRATSSAKRVHLKAVPPEVEALAQRCGLPPGALDATAVVEVAVGTPGSLFAGAGAPSLVNGLFFDLPVVSRLRFGEVSFLGGVAVLRASSIWVRDADEDAGGAPRGR